MQVRNDLVVIYSNINFYRKKYMAALKKLTDEGVIIREGEGLHLLMEGGIKMIIPHKPNSRNQKYKKVNSEGKGHVSLLTKDEGESLITLYTPALEDLWFRQKMMADMETM